MKSSKRSPFRASMMLGLTLGLTVGLSCPAVTLAQSVDELLDSAQAKYRARQHDAAQADAAKARELATTTAQKIDADLLMAQILARQNKIEQGLKLLQDIIDHQQADAVSVAQARIIASGMLHGQKKYEQAREMIEPVFQAWQNGEKIDARYMNQAQRAHLQAIWGVGNWLVQGNLQPLQKEVQAIVSQPQEAWPQRNMRVLQDAGRMVQSAGNFAVARDFFEQALRTGDVPAATQFALQRDIATTYAREGLADEAYAVLEKLLETNDLSPADRARVHQDQAIVASGQGHVQQAVKYLEAAAAVKDLPAAQLSDVHASIVSTHLEALELHAAAKALRKLMAIENASVHTTSRSALPVIDAAVKLGEFELAESLALQLLAMDLPADSLRDAANRLALVRLRAGDVTGAREALQRISPDQGSASQRLVHRLQLAGTYSDQDAQMLRLVQETLDEHEKMAAREKIRALWDAAKLYFQARHDDVARVLIRQADRFGNQAVKTYRVQAVKRAPADVGQWQSSGLLDQPGVADARFYPYSQQDAAAMFAVDVRTERPFGDMNAKGSGPAATRVAMVYDLQGLHIYVQSDEPKIEQIMTRNGQGGSSLEMFFTPGTYNEPYYQWITNLAKNETTVYDWNSPHRFYRTLERKPEYFRSDTRPLESGWGTAIFISWEAFYDQMPMLEDQKQVWRFSMQRWDPSGSVTWGGRVHETGRWGHLQFDAPEAELKQAIKRNLIEKAWWQYQQVITQQSTFWTGLRGDQAFHEQVIKPLAEAVEAQKQHMNQIDQWDASQIDQAFREDVPRWLEAPYIIADKRKAFLRERLTADK